jgi:hypothetical protein
MNRKEKIGLGLLLVGAGMMATPILTGATGPAMALIFGLGYIVALVGVVTAKIGLDTRLDQERKETI